VKRVVVVLPDLLFPEREDSPLRQKLPNLSALSELGELAKLSPIPEIATPEAVWLGMDPREVQLQQGPLTVSALGADPPDRSTHFHLSLLGLVEGVVAQPPAKVADVDLRTVMQEAKRLNTKSLTILQGEHLDHGLVWEGLGDLHTERADAIIGKRVLDHLPEGDAEPILRRFIDDSVNLLTELELNQRRLDEGIAPLNLLWPWGHGVRVPVPNLALRRGLPVQVFSASMRLQGLTRLAGHRHWPRGSFGRGVGVRFEDVASAALSFERALVVLGEPGELRRQEMLEEEAWLVHQWDERFLAQLLNLVLKKEVELDIVAPSSAQGLWLSVRHGVPTDRVLPFDERALDLQSLRTPSPSQAIAAALA
jgi:hypothetical protein